MSLVNSGNELLKRRYLRRMQEARGLARSTIDNALRAIAEYEEFTGFRDFGKFASKDAIAFKKKLLAGGGKRAAELGNRSTVQGKLKPVQRFFKWLADQAGYRTKIRFGDVEFFNLSNHDAQIARDRPAKPSPTLEQVQHVIRSMPSNTDLEKRDRALVACILLTGARVSAVISLKLKHVRDDRLGIDQDARDVKTKFSKTFPSFFFQVGNDVRDIFLEYVDHLKIRLLWNSSDPLFPSTMQGGTYLEPLGFARTHWQNPDPVRRIFRSAFERAGVPYYSPHSIRRTLTLEGQRRCRTPEALKAWSQNLAHDDVLTTLCSYGAVPVTRQAELIASLGADADSDSDRFAALQALATDPRYRALFGK